MRDIDDIKDAEYDKIISEINSIYQQEVLLPIKPVFVDFFKKIQKFEDGYRTDIPSKKIEIVSIFYYAPSTLSFIFAMSDLEYYQQNNDISRPELRTESYDNYDEEALVMRILKKYNIDHEDLDYYDVWDDQFSLNHDFLLTCWQEAKTITNSKLYGFLFASDFAGGTTNLDNGDSFFGMDNTVEKYLTEKGIYIQKDT